MLIKVLSAIAVVLFLVWLVAVLQGWSKSTGSGRAVGLSFLVVFGIAAAWCFRTLTRW